MSDAIDELIDTLEQDAKSATSSSDSPDVGIIMGSDSDLEIMAGAYEALTQLGFEEITKESDTAQAPYTFETYVVSAHRTPDLMYAYANTAADRGIDVIIAGAGGKSADLPNMTASIAFPIPVIGVPVQEKSVNSVIGMPTGAPITAVDAGKSFNAALSAIQILARSDEELTSRLRSYHNELRQSVGEISRELNDSGTPAFRSRSDR